MLTTSSNNNDYDNNDEDDDTEVPHYNDIVCYQRFCCKIEFAVINKLNMDLSKV